MDGAMIQTMTVMLTRMGSGDFHSDTNGEGRG